jgi:uncharacterized damage-inducible protein DinB/GNAT superfamily N-acetyltransferase
MDQALHPPAATATVTVRALATRDSLVALTDLLNRAYAPLLARGMNFTASTQDVNTTRRRAADGQCFVAEIAGRVVGTVTACGPYDEKEVSNSHEGVSWYRDPDLAHFQQFGVDPLCQRMGVGRKLVAACEQWARERGFEAIALDTAEPAGELITMYRKLGYREVGFTQWPGKTYRSVVMRKRLGQSALREQLQTLARYNLWATQRLFESVDGLADEPYRRELGLFFKSVHGTLNHLLLADQELWFKRFAGEAPQVTTLADEVEPDRQRLKQRLLTGAARWQPWLEGVSEEQLTGLMHYRRITGQPASLPFAATLAHVFNHGTHHRGQITAALTMLGQPCPELDLVYMLQAEGQRS